MISSTKSPMAEMEIPGSVIFTIPISTINEVVTDMSSLADIWYECMETIHWFVGYRFKKPERFVTDVQISVGVAHSGYPVMARSLQTKTYDLAWLNTGKVWGIFHEFGHNLIQYQFVPRGAVEVTNNLIATVVNAKVNEPNHSIKLVLLIIFIWVRFSTKAMLKNFTKGYKILRIPTKAMSFGLMPRKLNYKDGLVLAWNLDGSLTKRPGNTLSSIQRRIMSLKRYGVDGPNICRFTLDIIWYHTSNGGNGQFFKIPSMKLVTYLFGK